MSLRTRFEASVLILTFLAFARPSAGQVVTVAMSVGQDGTRYVYEISQERADTLPLWDQNVASEPPLSLREARRTAEVWLTSRAADVKTFELAGVSFFRIAAPIGTCRAGGCWYYRLIFDPIVSGRRLIGGGDFTVVVLADGSVVEPRNSSPPVLSSGAGRGGDPGGPGTGTRGGGGSAPSLSPPGASGAMGPVYRPGNGVTSPQVVRQVKTQYTDAAMRAKVQGAVLLELVVKPDGTVGDVRVLRSVDAVYGLDDEAVKAARQWRFVPGRRQGVAVPVLINLEMTFSLR